jgi:predicted RNA-binding Zn-ribbon protein involved in translation (DUF1610 family)
MDAPIISAKCRICETVLLKKEINAHLKKHLTELQKNAQGTTTPMFHLLVLGYEEYFLHLLVPTLLTFDELDVYLRRIWLECCGHMSMFSIPKLNDEIDMDEELETVLEPKSVLNYIYDFGSSTELKIKVIAKYDLALNAPQKNDITLLARNQAYHFTCGVCGKSAIYVCDECAYEKENPFYCEACNSDEKKHECGEEYSLPICNSPRMGVCGYQGDKEVFKKVSFA